MLQIKLKSPIRTVRELTIANPRKNLFFRSSENNNQDIATRGALNNKVIIDKHFCKLTMFFPSFVVQYSEPGIPALSCKSVTFLFIESTPIWQLESIEI